MKRTLGLFLVLSLAAVGCRTRTGLNIPCRLVAGTGDGGVRFITEAELAARATFGGARSDFVTFGAVECEDLVCVRDGLFVATTDGGTDGGLDAGGGSAQGYCSRACTDDTQCVSDDPALDRVPSTRLGCRPLVLDAETLTAIKSDPVLVRLVGNSMTPTLCARDGGAR